VCYTAAITLIITTAYYIPIDVAGLLMVELKAAAHAYDFYGRTPVQRRINNTSPVAQLN
jgi:hypothetical protein